jgi:hypothetical protein
MQVGLLIAAWMIPPPPAAARAAAAPRERPAARRLPRIIAIRGAQLLPAEEKRTDRWYFLIRLPVRASSSQQQEDATNASFDSCSTS